MVSYYTSQRAVHWKKAKGQPKGWPPATKAWEKRDEVFIVLFDYSGVVMVR